jgi:hypothetical protein
MKRINKPTNSWRRILLLKLTIPHLIKKFTVFYGTRNNLPLVHILGILIPSQASQPISLRFTLILFSHLQTRLSSGLFLSGFPIKILYAYIISPIRATLPTQFILLDLISLIIFDHVRGRVEVHKGFLLGDLLERHHLEEARVDGRKILKSIIKKKWTGFLRPRIGTVGG